MNLLELIDPEIDAERFEDEYVIMIETEYGTVTIEVAAWVADMALSEARKSIDDAGEQYQNLFDKIEVALND